MAVLHSVLNNRFNSPMVGPIDWPAERFFFYENEKDFLTLKSGTVTCTKQESAGMKVMWSEDACGWGDEGGVSVRGGSGLTNAIPCNKYR